MNNPAVRLWLTDDGQFVRQWDNLGGLGGGVHLLYANPAAAISLAPDRSGRIYIAGPMTDLPDFNFPAFNDMAAILRGLGYHVENPAEHGVVEGAEWADYLRYDIARLATCEALVLLPGWRNSRGALLEVHIAKALGIQIMFAEDFSRLDAEEDA